MKKKYYKPRKLISGLLLLALSLIGMGMLAVIHFQDCVQYGSDRLYIIGLVIGLISMVIGEGLVLDAASYDVKKLNKQEEKNDIRRKNK